jgi:hypothetical protein
MQAGRGLGIGGSLGQDGMMAERGGSMTAQARKHALANVSWMRSSLPAFLPFSLLMLSCRRGLQPHPWLLPTDPVSSSCSLLQAGRRDPWTRGRRGRATRRRVREWRDRTARRKQREPHVGVRVERRVHLVLSDATLPLRR